MSMMLGMVPALRLWQICTCCEMPIDPLPHSQSMDTIIRVTMKACPACATLLVNDHEVLKATERFVGMPTKQEEP